MSKGLAKTIQNLTSLCRTIYFVFAAIFYFASCIVIIPVVYFVHKVLTALGLDMWKFKSSVGKIWLLVTQSLLCILIGDNTYMLYKEPPENINSQNTLIISNHTTYIDWVYLWSLLIETGRENISFIAKEAIGSIYFLKLGMKMLNFVLLSRKMEQDKSRLKEACSVLHKSPNYNLVVFPEGTFIDPATEQASKDFLSNQIEIRKKLETLPKEEIERLGLHVTIPSEITAPFKQVIFPRVKGFTLLVNELKDSIKYIMDCTIYLNMDGTLEEFPSHYFTLKNILLGRCSRMQAVIICDNIVFNKSIADDSSNWMYKQFKKKDELLMKIKGTSINDVVLDYETNLKYKKRRVHPSLPVTIFLSAGALAIIIPVFYVIWQLFLLAVATFVGVKGLLGKKCITS
ncbi:hypothetical protein NEMIN01_2080 [Nematocida minor]|uniref:uncharacterized protein n=1 Tax=Nematocida minor TaxID=1912983 RepID=UPI00221F7A18|nr:uncharacterized protein NEMIN01_2080 [Nematocida minor]KAI5192548.1 hypothetical protein NEMIN01_2080 [Nematocida minor]